MQQNVSEVPIMYTIETSYSAREEINLIAYFRAIYFSANYFTIVAPVFL